MVTRARTEWRPNKQGYYLVKSLGSLHMAMREYIRWLEDTLHDDSTDSISGWGNSQRRQTKREALDRTPSRPKPR